MLSGDRCGRLLFFALPNGAGKSETAGSVGRPAVGALPDYSSSRTAASAAS
jgi:hypothetical protein